MTYAMRYASNAIRVLKSLLELDHFDQLTKEA